MFISKRRHGLKQPRNPWSDGTEFITMCGVPPGRNFTYTLLFTTEEGTIWYHAHSEWTRATVYGAIVVYPKMGATYPFPKPDKEYVVVLGIRLSHSLNLYRYPCSESCFVVCIVCVRQWGRDKAGVLHFRERELLSDLL